MSTAKYAKGHGTEHATNHHDARPTKNGYGPEPKATQRPCVPCDIPPFCRNHYFKGKLLTEQDFTLEQQYFRDKFRLHYRALHGWGVVCGLRVRPHPYCPDKRLVVEPGIAIDPCGYEIVVPREVEIELPAPPPERPAGCPPPPCDDPTQQAEPDCPKPRESERPVYVCIRYVECDTVFMPAPFDECGCNAEGRRRPTRICEEYDLHLEYGEPPRIEHCYEGDCADIFYDSLRPCPDPKQAGCMPLAYLANYAPGDFVTDDMIDNRGYRPLLPSVQLHDRLLRCILDRLPMEQLTRVSDTGWTHDQEYHCHDFIRFFTGHAPGESAFEVRFDNPVRTEGLTPQTFQAIIARHGGGGMGPLEIAPSRVWAGEHRRSFYLQIDRNYAERDLVGTRFDVYLTLRCGLILDEQGRPVDGDLVARLNQNAYVIGPPSGNGVPGGNFESWIRVR
jgi:hypothetical protein